MFATAVILFGWCKAHARARGIEPPSAAPLLVGLIALIGVPYYFFKTMPWRAAAMATLKAVGFLILLTLVNILCFQLSAYWR